MYDRVRYDRVKITHVVYDRVKITHVRYDRVKLGTRLRCSTCGSFTAHQVCGSTFTARKVCALQLALQLG